MPILIPFRYTETAWKKYAFSQDQCWLENLLRKSVQIWWSNNLCYGYIQIYVLSIILRWNCLIIKCQNFYKKELGKVANDYIRGETLRTSILVHLQCWCNTAFIISFSMTLWVNYAITMKGFWICSHKRLIFLRHVIFSRYWTFTLISRFNK